MSSSSYPPGSGPEQHTHGAGDHDHAHDAHHHAHDAAGHHHHDHHHHASRRALGAALGLTLAFLVVELVVGLWSRSLALVADAGHMLGDAGALGLSFWVAHISRRPRSVLRTYGYRRAEVLGAVLNASMLTVIAVWVAVHAVERILSPVQLVHVHGLLGTAVVGLIVNLTAAWILHRHGGGGLNVRAALLHVMGDLLGSILAIGAGVSVLGGATIADPLASLVIALLLLWGGLRLLREATHVLMEGTPTHLNVVELERVIADTPGVRSVHDLHVWSLTPETPMLTAHVVIVPTAHGTDVAQRVGERVREHFRIEHVTIQPEAPGPKLVPLRVPGRRRG
jgi:cobalt-zinc-cadmium efflux system protein